VLPHPQQKAMSPASPYITPNGDVAHQYIGDNNNENDYSMHNVCYNNYFTNNQMSHHAVYPSMQNYYPSNPNSPDTLTNKTLTELNSLPPYNGETQDQVINYIQIKIKLYCYEPRL
jgi:hypothetical protein